MAVVDKYLSQKTTSRSTTDAFKNAMALKAQREAERRQLEQLAIPATKALPQKTGTLGRAIAGLGAFETGSAAYKAITREGNRPGLDVEDVTTFLKQYGKDIKGGLKVAATGKDTEDYLKNKKTYADIATKLGMQQRKGKIDVADVVGFIGDVALDPTTWATFGTGAGAKVATKTGTKTLSKEGTKVLAKMSANVGSDIAEKTMQKALEKSPTLAKRFLDQGGAKFAGKTLVTAEQLGKVPLAGRVLQPIGEKGLITGTAKGVLDVGEAIPGVRNVVTPVRQTVGEAFNRGYALKGTAFEGLTRKLDKFNKVTNVDIEKAVGDFLDSSSTIVKKNQKEFGGLKELGRAITNYVEEGTPIAVNGARKIDVEDWVEKQLKPVLSTIGETEKRAGLIDELIGGGRYIPRVKTKEYLQSKARQAFGAREVGKIKPTLGAGKSRTFAPKFIDENGNQIVGNVNARPIAETKEGKELIAQAKFLENRAKREAKKLTETIGPRTKALSQEEIADLQQRAATIRDRLNKEFVDKEGKKFTYAGQASTREANIFAGKEGLTSEGTEMFNVNVFETVPRRIAESIRAQRSKELLDNLSSEFGVKVGGIEEIAALTKTGKPISKKVATELPEGYTTTNIAGLEGVAFPKEIIKELQTTHAILTNPDSAQKLLKAYDNIMKYWKLSVTTAFPAFHLRNLQGGIFNNFLAGVSPAKYAQATQLMNFQKTGKDSVVKIGGKSYKASELLDLARKESVLGTTGMMDIIRQQGIKGAGNIAQKAGKKAMGATTAIASNVEEFLRLPLFLDGISKGETPRMAAERVWKFHFDYNAEALTGFERGFMKRVMPFYTWTRNNIPLQFEQIGKQPGKYGATTKLMQGDREQYWEEQKYAPEYMQKQTNFRLPSGKYLTVGLPMADIARVTPSEMFANVSPAIKSPLEALFGYDSFKNRPIVKDMASPEEKKQAWTSWALNAIAGRSVGAVKDFQKILYGDEEAKSKAIMKQVFGLNVTDINKYATTEIKSRLLEQLPKELQQAYQAAHINYEDQYPLMASTRKASVYIDFPELFLLDQSIKQFDKEKNGKEYDPIYDLPWDKAQVLYAQTAAGDKWNSKEIRNLPWFSEFSKKRTQYFDKTKESDGEGFKMESDKFYQEPSASVQSKMDAGNFDDAQVKSWLEQNKVNTELKRQEIGLVTPDRYNLENELIYGKGAELAKSLGSKLKYMQALRMAGLGYDSFFEEHPELDPLQGAPSKGLGAGYSGGSGSKSVKQKKVTTKISPYKLDKLKTDIKTAKLKSVQLDTKVRLPNAKDVKQWTK